MFVSRWPRARARASHRRRRSPGLELAPQVRLTGISPRLLGGLGVLGMPRLAAADGISTPRKRFPFRGIEAPIESRMVYVGGNRRDDAVSGSSPSSAKVSRAAARR